MKRSRPRLVDASRSLTRLRPPLRAVSLALLALSLIVLLGATARPAAAHQTSMKQLDLRVADRSIDVVLRASVDDVISAIGRDLSPLPRAELLGDPAVIPTLTSWVKIAVDAGPCAAEPGRATDDTDPRFLAVRWRLVCPGETLALTLDLETFFFLDAVHTMVVRVEGQGASLDTVIGVDDSPLRLKLAATPRSFLRWVELGVAHLFTSADHVCFLLALLLAVVITREAPRPAASRKPHAKPLGAANAPQDAASWQVAPWRTALRRAALLITAFSTAHSLTLIAASLGWVSLPARLVETAIAASVLYAAVENAVYARIGREAPRRWRLTFLFGLVHGLGFASALSDLLPADRVVGPLVAFNLGVVAGQLVISIAVLPLLLGLARLLRAHRYRARWLPLSSILLGSLALMWSVERALGLKFW